MHFLRSTPLARILACVVAVLVGCRAGRPERGGCEPPRPPSVEPRRVAWTQPAVPSERVAPGQLSGLVVDEESGLPLFGAQVHVVGAALQAYSDSSGLFSVQLRPGRQSIRVRRIGYASLSTDVVAREDSGYAAVFTLAREPVILCHVTVGMHVPQPAVEGAVRDALTDQPLLGVVKVTATDGAFRDSVAATTDSLGYLRRPLPPIGAERTP